MKLHKAGILFVMLTALAASAQSMSELKIFARCYSHLTGKPLPLKHPLKPSLLSGEAKAVPACQALLDKAELDPSGPLVLKDDAEARAVLNQFDAFHRTWFSASTVDQIQDYNEEASLGTIDIYDATEPGLALTRAAFARNSKYMDVVTSPIGVHALREEKSSVKSSIGWNVTYPGRRIHGNNPGFDLNLFNFRSLTDGVNLNSDTTNSSFLTMPKIEVGELVGVRPTTESMTVPNIALSTLGQPDRRGNVEPGLNFSYDFFKSHGGGVLGSPIYFLLNYGHGIAVQANATTKVPRRWSQANLNSFLCLDLPALRETDVRQFVVGNSTAPFRNSASCVMCHATLDQMAYTARNLIVGNTDYFRMQAGSKAYAKTAFMVTSYQASLPSVAGWPSEPVSGFHQQTPSGRLFFRSVTGDLIDQPVSGISGLGTALSQTKDYYYCAAKRYFEFLTGIQVAYFDRTNPANAEVNRKLSPEAVEDRLFIESLGNELQKTQSVRQLIKNILASKYYRNVNYREK